MPGPAVNATAERQERPTFKVESRFVEVPVLIESAPGKTVPQLSEKDFRIYEDGSLREIAIFRQGVRSDDITQLRESAMASAQPGTMASFADPQELLLGRYYLVIDDLASHTESFMRARQAAEQILREYHSPVRPMSLHFTSSASADIVSTESLETMVARLKKTAFKGDSELTSNDGIMSVYEAYLIERGDSDARQLAELRYAASIFVEFQNDLGEVDGQNTTRPEMIEMTVQDTARSLLTRNFGQMSRTVDGLRAVVNAAAADPGSYPKSILFLSSGFSVGRNSMRGDTSSMLDSVIAAAKRKGIRVFTVNAAGLEVQQGLGIGASGAFLVRNPHLQSLLESHAQGWRLDREGVLFQLAKETGGRFIHSNNDLIAASGEALRSAGQLYYLGFMSRQPVDGRFHNIRVVASAPVKVTARKGFYAGLGSSKVPAELENEDWNAVLASAEQARKAGDVQGFAAALEKLVQKFPNQANFWYNLGSAQMALNRPEAAADSFQKCFALSPDDKAAGAALSRSLAAAGFRSAAAQTLELVAQRHPRDLEVLVQLGRVYETDSRTGDAYQAYRRILDITLNPPLDVYVLLTRTSMRLGRSVEAELFIDDFLKRGGPESSIDPWRQELTASRR
jgi:VWFA-related protein